MLYRRRSAPTYSQETDLAITLQEYSALRAQVQTFMTFEMATVNFAIIVSGIVAAALYQPAASAVFNRRPSLLLAIAPFFPTLGLMNMYEKVRLFCTVAYIDVYLRIRLKALAGRDVLLWEDYLSSFRTSLMVFLDRLRSAIFLTPTFLLLILFFYKKSHTTYSWLDFMMISITGTLSMLYLSITIRSDLDVYKQIAERRVRRDLKI